MEKGRSNIILISFDVFSILFEIAGNLLLYINVTQWYVLLTLLYGCVAEERCQPTECYRYFVSDYA